MGDREGNAAADSSKAEVAFPSGSSPSSTPSARRLSASRRCGEAGTTAAPTEAILAERGRLRATRAIGAQGARRWR